MPRLAILAAVFFALSTTESLPVSKAVRDGCISDYAAYCSQYEVKSAAVRRCMRAHRHQLSDSCIHALGNSDEVTAEDIRRYKREHRRR
jgi:hypothetical protein